MNRFNIRLLQSLLRIWSKPIARVSLPARTTSPCFRGNAVKTAKLVLQFPPLTNRGFVYLKWSRGDLIAMFLCITNRLKFELCFTEAYLLWWHFWASEVVLPNTQTAIISTYWCHVFSIEDENHTVSPEPKIWLPDGHSSPAPLNTPYWEGCGIVL